MAPRETENNAYAKFWGDKQRALWYVMVFSGVVNDLRSYPYTKCSVRDKACVTGTWKWWDRETTRRARETCAHSF